jgi:hypothetical protein
MAEGLGFKTFTTGEVLTAADVNGYLMQGVLVFASEAARDAAITSPQEGQFAFTKDNNSLWYYSGAAWVASGATGDIEGVTAGTGISGGGTSGTVTITNSMATEIDAKADLVVGTGADAFARLAVGANGTVLTAASGEATGLEWAAPAAGGGKVLQVVQVVYGTEATSSSQTFVDTGLSATITPTLDTSTILVMANHFTNGTYSGGGAIGNLQLFRDATQILDGGGDFQRFGRVVDALCFNYVYLDSPATTSATTYKTKFANEAAAGLVAVQRYNTKATMILMEIGA